MTRTYQVHKIQMSTKTIAEIIRTQYIVKSRMYRIVPFTTMFIANSSSKHHFYKTEILLQTITEKLLI